MRPSIALTALLLSACSLAPDAQLPTQRVPEHYAQAGAGEPLSVAGWEAFGSPELTRLIAQALAHNTDLEATLARVAQARANARISGGDLYPQVSGSGDAARAYRDGSGHSDSASVGLAISYEVDLWQRNRNRLEAALFEWRASSADHAAQRLLVASEVARLYTGILAFDARLAVAGDNLKHAQEVLRITEARYDGGSISGLERAQQRTSVANTEAALASLKNQRALFFHELAQLAGMAPAQFTLAGEGGIGALALPALAVGEPWELLARRPDIAASEARLRAAHIDIGIARAEALPSLSLAMNAGMAANPSTAVGGLAASFFAPIFQGGKLEGAIDRSEAVRDERIASYEGVLLNALREVEDALANLDAAQARRDALAVAAAEARKAETIARTRFDAGSIDYTTLITTQQALLQADDSYYSALQAALAAHIDLMRALGGPVAAGKRP